MRALRFNRSLALRILASLIALGVLAGIAGASLAPGVPLTRVLLYAAGGALIGLALLVGLAAVTFGWSQWALRGGGTDPQWLWFSAEPPGLARERGTGQVEGSS